MAYSTTDEEFNEQAYAGAGLQPSVGERATMAFDNARQIGNNGTRVTGVALRRGGKRMQRSGTKMMRTGAALSRSGVGALVGVPLMAAGAAVRGAGNVNTTAGRNLTNQSQTTKNLLRSKGLRGAKKDIKKRVAATRVNLSVLSMAMPIWFTLQLPLALGAIAALVLAGAGQSAIDAVFSNPVTGFLYTLFDSVTNGVEYVTGVNLNVLEQAQQAPVAIFGALQMLVFFIGLFILGFMSTMYTFSGVRCFFGEHAALKSGLFIFALLGYLMPILNLLPWFVLWGIAVWRYPK
jgi:hypothetical protein